VSVPPGRKTSSIGLPSDPVSRVSCSVNMRVRDKGFDAPNLIVGYAIYLD